MNLTPGVRNRQLTMHSLLAFSVAVLMVIRAEAAVVLPPGDSQLRDDIQLLAAWDVITGPTSTWPIAWRQVEADLNRFGDDSLLPERVRRALLRLRARVAALGRKSSLHTGSRASVAGDPGRLRSFQSVPREEAELQGLLGWAGARFHVQLAATAVRTPTDGQSIRADGSQIGVTLGNYAVAASMTDRWWGPGWDGSLILSNNARPFPAITIDRNSTSPFSSRWLNWIGPWDVSLIAGRLESDRHVPHASFLGLRLTARPHSSIEIGLSRTAQWCGEGRPCDFDTFSELFRGNDNRGESGVSASNEPGNQLAGIDLRWMPRWFDRSYAVYGQWIGEDEAGGLPSRYLGQLGIERSGTYGFDGNYRWFAEFAGTSCDFYKREEIFNCAYNHTIYQTGYRYRGRTIGHAADNDSKIVSVGFLFSGAEANVVQGVFRIGRLNRIGPPDPRNSLTAARLDLASADVIYRRTLAHGTLSFSAGYDYTKDAASDSSDSGARAFIEWRSDLSQ